MTVLIGVDRHKGSHTAVAIDRDEAVIDELRVEATVGQVDELVGWAKGFESRSWAVESAGGLGYLLSQQLVAAGETVLDVPATLAARVRVLGHRAFGQERPQRRPVRRDRRAPRPGPRAGAPGGSCERAALVGQTSR